ncbi:hypothetical protein FACS1894189_7500 [Planctomycetales bacterium]|nr:hypothetical protein FACS1894189_7500 [Planctomycetales bacterium]
MENPMWDTKNSPLWQKMQDQEKGAICLGLKACWQEYPCITAHSKDYALIVDSLDFGRIVDKDGNTIVEGKPTKIVYLPDYGLDFLGVDFRSSTDEYKFWEAKYPELLYNRYEKDWDTPNC